MSENKILIFPLIRSPSSASATRIPKLSLFGSELRDDFRPDSDIDLLVEFQPGEAPSLFDLARMEMELSTVLDGRKVDLRTPNELSRYFRDEVLSTASVQYAEG